MENSETVIATLSANASYTIGTPNSATVTIADNDNPIQTVSIVASDASAGEVGLNSAIFTVVRSGSTAAALTVKYSAAGTASLDRLRGALRQRGHPSGAGQRDDHCDAGR